MKNKMLTYFLGFAVLVVWGLILYRIFDATGGGDEPSDNLVRQPVKKESYNDYEVKADTAHLLLNYRDPFSLVKQKDTAQIPVKKLISRERNIIPAKPAFNWGFIQYSGYVRNPGSKSITTLLVINGQNVALKEGEVKNQVKLVKNMRDSVRISFNGQTKFIGLKPATL